MRTRRAFSPVLESMPTLVIPGSFINPVSPVTVPCDPPPSFINPVAPVTVPVPPIDPAPPFTGPDSPDPIGETPILIA